MSAIHAAWHWPGAPSRSANRHPDVGAGRPGGSRVLGIAHPTGEVEVLIGTPRPTAAPTDTLVTGEARTGTAAVAILLLALGAAAGLVARLLDRPTRTR